MTSPERESVRPVAEGLVRTELGRALRRDAAAKAVEGMKELRELGDLREGA